MRDRPEKGSLLVPAVEERAVGTRAPCLAVEDEESRREVAAAVGTEGKSEMERGTEVFIGSS